MIKLALSLRDVPLTQRRLCRKIRIIGRRRFGKRIYLQLPYGVRQGLRGLVLQRDQIYVFMRCAIVIVILRFHFLDVYHVEVLRSEFLLVKVLVNGQKDLARREFRIDISAPVYLFVQDGIVHPLKLSVHQIVQPLVRARGNGDNGIKRIRLAVGRDDGEQVVLFLDSVDLVDAQNRRPQGCRRAPLAQRAAAPRPRPRWIRA